MAEPSAFLGPYVVKLAAERVQGTAPLGKSMLTDNGPANTLDFMPLDPATSCLPA